MSGSMFSSVFFVVGHEVVGSKVRLNIAVEFGEEKTKGE